MCSKMMKMENSNNCSENDTMSENNNKVISPTNDVMKIDSKNDKTSTNLPSAKIKDCLEFCCDKDNCLSLDDMLRSFNAPLSEEQAWSLIYQTVLLYRNFIHIEFIDKHTKKDRAVKCSHRIKVPKSPRNLKVHKDGSIHICDKSECFKFLIYGLPLIHPSCFLLNLHATIERKIDLY